MAKRIASSKSMTPTATANTTNLVDDTYPFAFLGGSTTQRNIISEFYLGGQAGASAPTIMVAAMDSQVATGSLTKNAVLNDAPLDAATAALAAPPTVFSLAATNKPQRSASLSLLNLSFNAFGGIVRWVAAPGSEIMVVGNAAGLGQLSLSAFTGGTPGLLGSHMIFESL